MSPYQIFITNSVQAHLLSKSKQILLNLKGWVQERLLIIQFLELAKFISFSTYFQFLYLAIGMSASIYFQVLHLANGRSASTGNILDSGSLWYPQKIPNPRRAKHLGNPWMQPATHRGVKKTGLATLWKQIIPALWNPSCLDLCGPRSIDLCDRRRWKTSFVIPKDKKPRSWS